MKRNRRRAQAGVTLIEMLVVVTIIGLFVALVGPKLWNKVDYSRVTAARTQIQNFMTALGNYKLDTGTFPTTEQGLQAYYWANDQITCTVVGDMAEADLPVLAKDVYQQLSWRPDPPGRW